LYIPCIRAAGKPLANKLRRWHRAIRLWLRLYGLPALYDLHCPRSPQHGSLRDLHGVHVARHDAARHVQWVAAGTPGVRAFLHLGACCNDSLVPRCDADPSRPGVRQARRDTICHNMTAMTPHLHRTITEGGFEALATEIKAWNP